MKPLQKGISSPHAQVNTQLQLDYDKSNPLFSFSLATPASIFRTTNTSLAAQMPELLYLSLIDIYKSATTYPTALSNPNMEKENQTNKFYSTEPETMNKLHATMVNASTV